MATIEEVQKKYAKVLADLEKENKPLAIAARSIMANMASRIFTKGKDSTDSQITNKKTRKAGYAAGYAKYRQSLGRQISFVDLKLTNDLQLDFSNAQSVGQPPTPEKVNVQRYQIRIKRANNLKKVEDIQIKYGTIFSLTKIEREEFIRIATLEFQKFINNA